MELAEQEYFANGEVDAGQDDTGREVPVGSGGRAGSAGEGGSGMSDPGGTPRDAQAGSGQRGNPQQSGPAASPYEDDEEELREQRR